MSLDKKGNFRWQYETQGWIHCKPFVNDEGILVYDDFTFEEKNALYSIDLNGKLRRTETFLVQGDFVPISDGRCVVIAEKEVICLDKNGRKDWVWMRPANFSDPSRIFGNDAHILVNGGNKIAYLHQNGTTAWNRGGSQAFFDWSNRILVTEGHSLLGLDDSGGTHSQVFLDGLRNFLALSQERIIVGGDERIFCLGPYSESLPGKPTNVRYEDYGVTTIYCALPAYQRYPFISRINLYMESEEGEFVKILTDNSVSDNWQITRESSFWADNGKYYCTYENRLGEGPPSEVIEIGKEGPFSFGWYLCLIVPSMLLVIAMMITGIVFIMRKGGKR